MVKRFRSNTTGRGAKSENSIAFCSEIKALCKKGPRKCKGSGNQKRVDLVMMNKDEIIMFVEVKSFVVIVEVKSPGKN